MNLGPYQLSECIITATKNDKDNIILAKNRDRIMKTEIIVNHEIINGIEVVYLEDMLTKWREGINEFGICIVNTALMVGFDDKQEKLLKKGDKKGKSGDGDRIMKALEYKDIDAAMKSLVKYDSGIKGHSFVTDGETVYSIEATTKHKSVDKKLEMKSSEILVRTNHGEEHKSAGYSKKDPDRKSSEVRKEQAEVVIGGNDTPEQIIRKLRVKNYEFKSPLNMNRDGKHITTSTMALDPKNLTFYLLPDPKTAKFGGVKTKLPKGYKPKIKIEILEEK